jgi:hypothetical protein
MSVFPALSHNVTNNNTLLKISEKFIENLSDISASGENLRIISRRVGLFFSSLLNRPSYHVGFGAVGQLMAFCPVSTGQNAMSTGMPICSPFENSRK